MLLIHWTKQNNTTKILKNGIQLSRKPIEGLLPVKGLWCYPYSRNKSLNTNWKSFLKTNRGIANYNGFVFRLEKGDFPIYAGEFGTIAINPEASKFESYEQFLQKYGKYFSPKLLAMESMAEVGSAPDYDDFEIILSKPIAPERIIKVLKDRDKK